MRSDNTFSILPQPDDTSCGPTCLQAVYNYYGDTLEVRRVIEESRTLKEGGTLAVMLGLHALQRGYEAIIYTYNLQVFDPTWFKKGISIKSRLREQAKFKSSKKLRTASKTYVEFVDLGGKIAFEDLTRNLLRKYLLDHTPILTGLSSTYLYQTMRERGEDCESDDLRGEPTGHFVVLHDYNRIKKTISVADPYSKNPMSKDRNYSVHIDRVIGAILLGIVTYDANLLIIRPKK